MKISIDNSPLSSGHKGRGVGTYVHNLKSTFERLELPEVQFDFTPDPYKRKSDIVHYPYFDLYFHTLPLLKPTPTIVTIHDLIPPNYPKEFSPGLKGSLKLLIQRLSLENTKAILTDSNASKRDIVHHLKIDPSKIHVIYLAAGEECVPQNQKEISAFKHHHNLKVPIIGYVGDINYNKNLPKLIQAFSGITTHQLVIVTRANLNASIPEALAIKSAIQLSSADIRVLKIASQKELLSFYGACDWYIQPSLAEGFGLPVLEAMQVGTPVISSNKTSLKEIVGEAAITFDPNSITQMILAIKLATKASQDFRNKKIHQGFAQAKKFSWKKTAKETLAIYTQIFNSAS